MEPVLINCSAICIFGHGTSEEQKKSTPYLPCNMKPSGLLSFSNLHVKKLQNLISNFFLVISFAVQNSRGFRKVSPTVVANVSNALIKYNCFVTLMIVEVDLNFGEKRMQKFVLLSHKGMGASSPLRLRCSLF